MQFSSFLFYATNYVTGKTLKVEYSQTQICEINENKLLYPAFSKWNGWIPEDLMDMLVYLRSHEPIKLDRI